MKVGIDAHCLGKKKTGNETYTRSLIENLANLEHDGVEYTAYLGAPLDTQHDFSNGWFRSKQIRPANPIVRIPISFAVQSRLEKLDVFHAQYLLPYNLRCATVLTVHDILFERFPEYFTKWDYYTMKWGVRRSCERADHIITVSETSKRDLVELYGLDTSKISVTYLGAETCFRRLDTAESRKRLKEIYGIAEEFILYVGAIQPRKNIPRLLTAFTKLKCEYRLPHKLVIVGPRAWLPDDTFESLERSPAKKDVLVTGYIPRNHLAYFYNAASVFTYVSMCEGFGLPIVEAMACGTPTITSRDSALQEIAGDAAVLVDPANEDSIASAIWKVLSDCELRTNLREKGLARSRLFSCAKMAIQTQQIYRRTML